MGGRGGVVRRDHRRVPAGLLAVREHPGAEEQEAQDGRREVGGDEDGQLGGVRRVAGGRVQGGQGATGQGESDAEDDQALRLVPHGAAPAAHPEGQPAVGCRVGDRRDEQGERVGDLRAGELPEGAVEEQVEEGGQAAYHAEPDELAGEPLGHVLDLAVARVVAEGPGEPVQRQ